MPVVPALDCTVLTACCQLGSVPVTAISRYTLHMAEEWEDEKALDTVDHVDNVESFIIYIAHILLLGQSDQECYYGLDIYEQKCI
jgi:hypothetical protein